MELINNNKINKKKSGFYSEIKDKNMSNYLLSVLLIGLVVYYIQLYATWRTYIAFEASGLLPTELHELSVPTTSTTTPTTTVTTDTFINYKNNKTKYPEKKSNNVVTYILIAIVVLILILLVYVKK